MKISANYLLPLLVVIASSIALFFLYSLFIEGESLIPSPHGPWIDTGPPLWINWSTAEIIHQALRAGHLPLWSDSIGIGTPLIGDPHLSYFSPFSFILYLWPNSYGWDVMVLSKAILTLVFSYALAIRLGLNIWICAWAAVLYGFSGHVFQFLHHFHTNSLVFVPLALIAVIDLFERKYHRGLALAAITMPLMIFGGGLLDVIILAALLALVSILYLLLGKESVALSYRGRFNHVFIAAMSFVLAIMIAAIWLIPYVELREVAIPPRANRGAAIYDNIWYLFGLFMKNNMATNVEYSHFFMKQIQYLSMIALPGFLLGIYTLLASRSRYQYFYLGLLILLALQFLKVFGFPLLQILNDIPILQDIRYEKYTGVSTLGFYLISGYGYQRIFQRKTAYPAILIFVSTAIVVALIFTYRSEHLIQWGTGFTQYLGFALYPLIAYLIWQQKFRNFKVLKPLIILVSSSAVVYQLSIDTNTNFAKRLEIFQKDTAVKAALAISDTKRFFPISAYGPRTWSADGLNDVRDISVVHINRYHKYFKNVIEKNQRCWHNFVLCSRDASMVYLDGLRWIGVDTIILPENQLPLLDKNPDKAWEYAGSQGVYHFVKLKNVEPLISVLSASQFSIKKPTLKRIKKDLESNNKRNYIEGHQLVASDAQENLDWQIDSISRDGVDSIIKVNSSQAAYLMIKQQFFPGWQASVSGQESPIYQANYLFQAIPIPAGSSTVILTYRPGSLRLGALLSIISLMLIIGIYRYIGPIDKRTTLASSG